ncbi:hypothetical protein BO71DRAFT_224395 [Aspergillus ellipticus CBS 707.79]|uniref:Uncharacterized protein n=1 Tax=Aspergillus ellipticus CBS 707.79 TaxID=1448320 RepID=A0A319E2E4_9EURO|nr:hypothetical protein BO71DRAFT_224395 [Aspergillus ellipticus CBS 707.79]
MAGWLDGSGHRKKHRRESWAIRRTPPCHVGASRVAKAPQPVPTGPLGAGMKPEAEEEDEMSYAPGSGLHP